MRITNSLKPHVAEIVGASFKMQEAIYQLAKQACADTNPDTVFFIMQEYHKISNIVRKIDRIAD